MQYFNRVRRPSEPHCHISFLFHVTRVVILRDKCVKKTWHIYHVTWHMGHMTWDTSQVARHTSYLLNYSADSLSHISSQSLLRLVISSDVGAWTTNPADTFIQNTHTYYFNLIVIRNSFLFLFCCWFVKYIINFNSRHIYMDWGYSGTRFWIWIVSVHSPETIVFFQSHTNMLEGS